jgi:excisionase family DNA binding protein
MCDAKDPVQKLLTIEEVAELFNVSSRHVSNLVKRKQLPQPIRLGRAVRFRLSDIRAILNPPPSSLF